jgi:hypothetical protein
MDPHHDRAFRCLPGARWRVHVEEQAVFGRAAGAERRTGLRAGRSEPGSVADAGPPGGRPGRAPTQRSHRSCRIGDAPELLARRCRQTSHESGGCAHDHFPTAGGSVAGARAGGRCRTTGRQDHGDRNSAHPCSELPLQPVPHHEPLRSRPLTGRQLLPCCQSTNSGRWARLLMDTAHSPRRWARAQDPRKAHRPQAACRVPELGPGR